MKTLSERRGFMAGAAAFFALPWLTLRSAHAQSDEALREQLRARSDSCYHPAGSCRMGPDPARGDVVDARLRVHGVDGLRVVDASIMPTLVSGNTNAPVIAIAEKAADLIREDWAARA